MILGSTIAQRIDQEQFVQLKRSRNILLSARAIEEKYDLLIENYLEFEKELLSRTVEQMIFDKISYDDFYELRSILNRRVINLLTSTKLYKDQIEKHVRECVAVTKSAELFTKPLFSEEYDKNYEYRFLEAIRNHVQHYGLAIHSYSLPSKWVGDDDNRKVVNTIQLFTHKEELDKDSQFHKKTLRELDEKIDLITAIRVYVNSFNIIHQKIRTIIDTNIIEARDNINKTIQEYENLNSGKSIGIYAFSVASNNPNAKVIEKFPIMLDWDNVRIKLIKKNPAHPNIHKHYVSGNCL